MARERPVWGSLRRVPDALPLLRPRLRSGLLRPGTALGPWPAPRGLSATRCSQRAARSPPGTATPAPAPPGARPLRLAAPSERARTPAAAWSAIAASDSQSG